MLNKSKWLQQRVTTTLSTLPPYVIGNVKEWGHKINYGVMAAKTHNAP